MQRGINGTDAEYDEFLQVWLGMLMHKTANNEDAEYDAAFNIMLERMTAMSDNPRINRLKVETMKVVGQSNAGSKFIAKLQKDMKRTQIAHAYWTDDDLSSEDKLKLEHAFQLVQDSQDPCSIDDYKEFMETDDCEERAEPSKCEAKLQ